MEHPQPMFLHKNQTNTGLRLTAVALAATLAGCSLNPFSGDDTDRALDSIARLLTAISAPEADEVGSLQRVEALVDRAAAAEQARREIAGAGVGVIVAGGVTRKSSSCPG